MQRQTPTLQVGSSVPGAITWLVIWGCLGIFSSGCSTLGYLIQAGRGQLELSNRARPMGEVIADQKTPTRIKKLLTEVASIKAFAESAGVRPTKNYTQYVHLNRPAAVWVVSACEALAFKSKEWSFPIVGRFPYLGWFDLEKAKKLAESLKAEGWDVDLRGARAFSTLGWFRDPLLSTMIPTGKEALGELVNVVIHESVHATLYISGQAFFNESLANYVAEKLTDRYLSQNPASAPEKEAYDQSEAQSKKSEKRLYEAYQELNQLYGSSQSDEAKRAEKARLLEALQKELGWKRPITNATLVQFKTYNTDFRAFDALFRACSGDWANFWKKLHTLEESSFSKSQQEDLGSVLSALHSSGC